jgi:hypothetical protein
LLPKSPFAGDLEHFHSWFIPLKVHWTWPFRSRTATQRESRPPHSKSENAQIPQKPPAPQISSRIESWTMLRGRFRPTAGSTTRNRHGMKSMSRSCRTSKAGTLALLCWKDELQLLELSRDEPGSILIGRRELTDPSSTEPVTSTEPDGRHFSGQSLLAKQSDFCFLIPPTISLKRTAHANPAAPGTRRMLPCW